MNFIPAKESALFILFFDWVTRVLIKIRFHKVWIKQQYQPDDSDSTIYYLNHNYWWDGLIPLLLNRKIFKQKARAIMEEKQMNKHGFFKRIGAFSINPDNPRSSIRSLRYALISLERPNSCLFIYPEGKIVPPGSQRPDFRKGLTWMCSKKNPNIKVVPIFLYIHQMRHSKPEIYINIGSEVNTENLKELSLQEKLEEKLYELQNQTRETAGYEDQGFNPFPVFTR